MREHFLVVVRRLQRAGGIARQAHRCCRKGSPFSAALCHSMRLLCRGGVDADQGPGVSAHRSCSLSAKVQDAIYLIAACAYCMSARGCFCLKNYPISTQWLSGAMGSGEGGKAAWALGCHSCASLALLLDPAKLPAWAFTAVWI